jgi:hypothetical protein
MEFNYNLPDLTHIGDKVRAANKKIKFIKLTEKQKQRAADLEFEQSARGIHYLAILNTISDWNRSSILKIELNKKVQQYVSTSDFSYNKLTMSRALRLVINEGKLKKVKQSGRIYLAIFH